MIYAQDKLNLQARGIAYGFMDGSLDFNPANPLLARVARKKLLKLISANFNKGAYYSYEVKQSHGSDIVVLDKNSKITGRDNHNIFDLNDADGVFTSESGITLCIRTADCIPILFACTHNHARIIGAVHCGWKGAYNGIIKNAINILINKFNSDINNAVAIIGPSICKNCYEVKEDFLNLFLAENTTNQKFFEKNINENKIFFELKAFVKNELILNGFNYKNIYDLNKCNFEDAGFFSYRRDKTAQRQVSFIVNL
ncbi:MAG: peptidoglycan editing factor PgeF [bacterium]